MTNPPLFSASSPITDTNIDDIIEYATLKVNENYPFPPQIIKVKGTVIGTLGNFSASVGKPKSKKSFNVSAIAAAAITGREVLNYSVALPEGKKRILYVDTEQSRPHCLKVYKRILQLAGISEDAEDVGLDFLVLREFTPAQRREIVDKAIQRRNDYSIVFIDGIRDLINDINSQCESNNIINDLMHWSSRYNLHIHTVLHLNKADDNTRGHIGTELNNKAETILQITKNAEFRNMSEVKAMHIRDREFMPFSFEIGDDSLPHIVTNFKSKTDGRLTFATLPEEQHRDALEKVFADGPVTGYNLLVGELQEAYESIGFKRGRNKTVQLIQYLQTKGVIRKHDKSYSYNPDAPLSIEESTQEEV